MLWLNYNILHRASATLRAFANYNNLLKYSAFHNCVPARADIIKCNNLLSATIFSDIYSARDTSY